jgi:hypothetical protein
MKEWAVGVAGDDLLGAELADMTRSRNMDD